VKRNREAHRRKARRFVWAPLQSITVERPGPDGEVMAVTAITTYGMRRMRVTRAGHHKPTGERVLFDRPSTFKEGTWTRLLYKRS
jgi:hypothetical protein